MKFSLLVLSEGKAQGKLIPIRVPRFLIGRDAKCHLRPSSTMVSKQHCALYVKNGKAYICDLKSTNGTFVNGERIQGEVQLKNEDRIRIAGLEFSVQLEVPVNKPTPLPEPAAPKSAEDEIAAMLLAMSEDEEEEPVNQDTTIVDMDALLTHQDEPAQPTRPTSKKSDRNKGKSDTQAAAEEILARFQRRNRR